MENIKKIEDNPHKSNLLKIAKGSIVSIIITLVALLITSIILTYTNVAESTIPTIIIAISAISILIGSIISSLYIKKNGLLNGGLVGAIYILTLYLLSSILVTGFEINTRTIIMFASSIMAGVIGGIIGVNMHKN